MIPDAKLERVLDRFHTIEAQLSSGHTDDFAKLSKEHSQLTPVVNAIRAYKDTRIALEESQALLSDPASDSDLKALAGEEVESLRKDFGTLERNVQLMLLPKDSADNSSAIVEIRAGTGGEEASLFAGDLLKMYTRYAQLQGWKAELLSLSESDLGGVKEAVLDVEGEGAYAKLKFESGVHRVQRVPVTEGSGRIHTSAATVAVLPEPEDVDVDVQDKDLRIDVYRASGAGGQHVNKTESAVRITHLPSGIAVAMQEEKSQHKNRAKAMKILKARLFEAERERQANARAAERKGLVGSGDRSERIRTYNFPQGRVSDHRINLTLYKLDRILSGDDLAEVVDALITEDQASRLAAEESERMSRDNTVLIAEAAKTLQAAGVESPRREARLLLGYAIGVGPLDIVSGRTPPMTAESQTRFAEFVARRAAREPLAYIVGKREFWSLDFIVEPSVLIPRPESEVLVEEALKRFGPRERPLSVLDLGTGSGCLLLAFLSERPRAIGKGVDISPDALAVARRNAQGLGLADRADFVLGNWIETVSGGFDAIFVNPPYIARDEIAGLVPEVARYEPRGALDGGIDGLDAYRNIAAGLLRCLNPGGAAFFEIGEGQATTVESVLSKNGFALGGTVCDLAGIPRCLVAVTQADKITPKKQLALETRSG